MPEIPDLGIELSKQQEPPVPGPNDPLEKGQRQAIWSLAGIFAVAAVWYYLHFGAMCLVVVVTCLYVLATDTNNQRRKAREAAKLRIKKNGKS